MSEEATHRLLIQPEDRGPGGLQTGGDNRTRYVIYVVDATRQRIAQVDDWTALNLVIRFNDVGTWLIDIPFAGLPTAAQSNSFLIELLLQPQFGIEVVRDGVTLMTGPVDNLHWQWDGSVNRLEVSGPDDNVWLSRRLVLPVPLGPPYTSAFDLQTGPCETVMKYYVDANAGPSARADRRVPGLTIEGDAARGADVSGLGRFQTLLSMLQYLAALDGGLGFKIVRDAITGGLEFVVYDVVDRSARARLTPDQGNVDAITYDLQAPVANYVIAGGAGDGAERVFLEGGDDASMAQYGRAEIFVDDATTSGEAAEFGLRQLASDTPGTTFEDTDDIQPVDATGNLLVIFVQSTKCSNPDIPTISGTGWASGLDWNQMVSAQFDTGISGAECVGSGGGSGSGGGGCDPSTVLVGADLSDNNGTPSASRFNNLDIAILKLYPSSFSSWTRTSYGAAKAGDPSIIGFYASDSTPTWAASKAAIIYALNSDGTTMFDHPFAFDLFEFGFSHSWIAREVGNAQKDGMIVGQYASDGNFSSAGEDWKWIARWNGPPVNHTDWVLWQDHNYLHAPGDGLADHNRAKQGVCVNDFLALTTVTGVGSPGGAGGGTDAGTRHARISVFSVLLEDATEPGHISVNFADTQTSCGWMLTYVANIDLDDPVAQTATGHNDSGTESSVTFANEVVSTNSVLGITWISAQDGISPMSSAQPTSFFVSEDGTPPWWFLAQFIPVAPNEVTSTWANSHHYITAAVELNTLQEPNLEQDIATTLVQDAEAVQITPTAVSDGSVQFPRDYAVGDIITATIGDVNVLETVIAVEVSVTGNEGEQIKPTLGTQGALPTPAEVFGARWGRQYSDRISQLEKGH